MLTARKLLTPRPRTAELLRGSGGATLYGSWRGARHGPRDRSASASMSCTGAANVEAWLEESVVCRRSTGARPRERQTGPTRAPAANTTPGEDAIMARQDRQPTAGGTPRDGRTHSSTAATLAGSDSVRRAVDAVFQQLDVVWLTRPLGVRSSAHPDFLELVERSAYACDRVR